MASLVYGTTSEEEPRKLLRWKLVSDLSSTGFYIGHGHTEGLSE